MTYLERRERKEREYTIAQAWSTQYYALSQIQSECQASPEDKGKKSHCKQGATFSPHVLCRKTSGWVVKILKLHLFAAGEHVAKK